MPGIDEGTRIISTIDFAGDISRLGSTSPFSASLVSTMDSVARSPLRGSFASGSASASFADFSKLTATFRIPSTISSSFAGCSPVGKWVALFAAAVRRFKEATPDVSLLPK